MLDNDEGHCIGCIKATQFSNIEAATDSALAHARTAELTGGADSWQHLHDQLVSATALKSSPQKKDNHADEQSHRVTPANSTKDIKVPQGPPSDESESEVDLAFAV